MFQTTLFFTFLCFRLLKNKTNQSEKFVTKERFYLQHDVNFLLMFDVALLHVSKCQRTALWVKLFRMALLLMVLHVKHPASLGDCQIRAN